MSSQTPKVADEVMASADTPLHAALGRKIREGRHAVGLTQAQLAERIAVSRSSLTNMELGRQRLLIDQLYKVASELNMKPADLLPSRLEIISASQSDAVELIPESVQRFADRILDKGTS
jgi:transcriptional regulator with XRE-family HTH domain